MKEKIRSFIEKVALTTFTAFFCITFVFLLVFTLSKEQGNELYLYQSFGYIFNKLYLCVFPFSLCLGFAARIFDLKKPRALLRLYHILLCLAGYFVFMDLLWFFVPAGQGANPSDYIKYLLPFIIGYPLTAAVTALYRAILTPKAEKKYKSILD